MKKISLLLCLALMLGLFAGCGAGQEEYVSVQSVSNMLGYGFYSMSQRFSGVVQARSEVKLEADSGKTVKETAVQEGDEVAAGDVLFTYDMELAQINLEKAALELEQQKASRTAKEKERETLQQEKARASASDQLSYTLEIQSCDTELRELEYTIAAKEKEVARLEENLSETQVTAPLAGRVKSLGTSEEGALTVTLTESGAFRVMGEVSELNAQAIEEGMEVLLRSRVNNTDTWRGTVSRIDWSSPISDSSSSYYYYESSDGDSDSVSGKASRYPFYVELEDSEGLLLGQHVTIEAYTGAETDGAGLLLPAEFLLEEEGDTAVLWAAGKDGKLEKRSVTVDSAARAEDPENVLILSGLELTDYIAWPSSELKAGMTVMYEE